MLGTSDSGAVTGLASLHGQAYSHVLRVICGATSVEHMIRDGQSKADVDTSMTVQSLVFRGYWREWNWPALPQAPGVYCVYACTYNERQDTLKLNRLLYIGQSNDVKHRIRAHLEDRQRWASALEPDEELCISYAVVANEQTRRQAEAALVNHHRPVCNLVVPALPSPTTVETSGRNGLLSRTTAPA